MLERARVYEPTVHEAAAAFGVDPEVLMGVGAAESAFSRVYEPTVHEAVAAFGVDPEVLMGVAWARQLTGQVFSVSGGFGMLR